MTERNPFEHKYVEKMLRKAHMPHAENKRKCRSFLRKMSRHIERAWQIGYEGGKSGKPLVPPEDLPQNNDSPMGRKMARYAYTAYRAGHRTGSAERDEG